MADALELWLQTLPSVARHDAEVRLRRLAQFLHGRRLRFLFGAGMSFKSGMPLAAKLSESLLREMFLLPGELDRSLITAYPVDAVAEAYIKKFDESGLFQIVNKTFERHVPFHDGHRALQDIEAQGFIERIYTTNFDTLIERAFSERGAIITDSNLDTLHTVVAENRVPVLHLHGAVGFSPKIVESEMFELDTPLGRLLTADMTLYWFAWMGYSMMDMGIRHLFFATRRALRLQRISKAPFVIYPLTTSDADLEWRIADQLWSARDCLFVPGTAEMVLPAIVTLLDRVEADAIVCKILSTLGRDTESPDEIRIIWGKAQKLASSGLGTEEEALLVLAEQYGAVE